MERQGHKERKDKAGLGQKKNEVVWREREKTEKRSAWHYKLQESDGTGKHKKKTEG